MEKKFDACAPDFRVCIERALNMSANTVPSREFSRELDTKTGESASDCWKQAADRKGFYLVKSSNYIQDSGASRNRSFWKKNRVEEVRKSRKAGMENRGQSVFAFIFYLAPSTFTASLSVSHAQVVVCNDSLRTVWR